jgi:hypothetical protein
MNQAFFLKPKKREPNSVWNPSLRRYRKGGAKWVGWILVCVCVANKQSELSDIQL